jgi:MFS family permease
VHASVYNAAAQILMVNLVIWAVQDRAVTPGLYGLALSAGGIGALFGTIAALRLADRHGYGPTFAASLALSTGAPLVIAWLPFEAGALGVALAAIQFVAGVGLGSANVLSTTLRQRIIPSDQLARTTGGYRMLMFGSIPIGSVLGGVCGEAMGTRAAVAIGSAGLVVSALPMLRPGARSLHHPEDALVRAA